MTTAWVLSETPWIATDRGGGGVPGSGYYGNPCVVGVALTAETAERWRDEPADGVKREIGPVPVIGEMQSAPAAPVYYENVADAQWDRINAEQRAREWSRE